MLTKRDFNNALSKINKCCRSIGMARYHFFRTDTDPIPNILSICRYRYRSDTKDSEYLSIPIPIRYQRFWISVDTDTDPIPKILSICRYRYRYQRFWVSADTDIDPIPKILSICRYRYRSDTKDSEYLSIPIPIRYQRFWVSVDTDIDPIPKILSICRYRYRSDTAQFFFKSVYDFYISVCVDLLITRLCITHNLLNIDNVTVKKKLINEYVIIIYETKCFYKLV